VSVYRLVPRRRWQTSCNTSSTQLCESYRTAASTTEDWPSSSTTLYTGLTSPTVSDSGCASKCTSVSTAWLPAIWLSSADVDGHRHLRSAGCGQLDVPQVRLSMYRRRAFCYVGPSAWNALPDFLNNDTLSLPTFRRRLKHFYFSLY